MADYMTGRERRLHALKIAASMKRPRRGEDEVPTAKELIKYARELAEYIYDDKDEKLVGRTTGVRP